MVLDIMDVTKRLMVCSAYYIKPKCEHQLVLSSRSPEGGENHQGCKLVASLRSQAQPIASQCLSPQVYLNFVASSVSRCTTHTCFKIFTLCQ